MLPYVAIGKIIICQPEIAYKHFRVTSDLDEEAQKKPDR